MSIIEYLTIASLSLGIIAVIGKYLIVIPLKNFIREQTRPIQPEANGGRSLADVAYTVNRIERRLDEHLQLHHKDKI